MTAQGIFRSKHSHRFSLGRALRRHSNENIPMKTKDNREKNREGPREELWIRPRIFCNSPTEKGRKASLFLNCPFSRKCSGLNVSGVAHSLGSLCSAVRLVRIVVP